MHALKTTAVEKFVQTKSFSLFNRFVLRRIIRTLKALGCYFLNLYINYVLDNAKKFHLKRCIPGFESCITRVTHCRFLNNGAPSKTFSQQDFPVK